jgi:hypothetical protein
MQRENPVIAFSQIGRRASTVGRSVRQFVIGIAIFVIAIQTVFGSAFAHPAAASPADPFSIICHSGGGTIPSVDGSGSTAPASDHSCCDYCVLCHATPGASAPDEAAYLIPRPRSARLAPALANEQWRPVFSSQILPRGPPGNA